MVIPEDIKQNNIYGGKVFKNIKKEKEKLFRDFSFHTCHVLIFQIIFWMEVTFFRLAKSLLP